MSSPVICVGEGNALARAKRGRGKPRDSVGWVRVLRRYIEDMFFTVPALVKGYFSVNFFTVNDSYCMI
jgi:hypothetical protein